MEKEDNMQKQIGNVSREMEILRKGKKEMFVMEIAVTIMNDLMSSFVDWM